MIRLGKRWRTAVRATLSLLAQLVVVWGLMSWLGIAMIRTMPGDPVEFFVGNDAQASAADIALWRHRAGLDQSVTTQWWRLWTSGEVPLTRTHEPVWQVLLSSPRGKNGGFSRLGWSLWLSAPPFAAAVVIAAGAGVWLGRSSSRIASRLVMTATSILMTIPVAVLALLLIWATVALRLSWPSLGAHSAGEWTIIDIAGHVVLPWIVGVLTYLPTLLRTVIVQSQQAWHADHVTAARSQGASEVQLAWRSVLPMVVGPLLSWVAAWLPALVGGAVLVENIFAWPGLGRLQLEALQRRDVWLAVMIMMILCTVALVGTRILEGVRAWIDPRVVPR